MVQSLWFALAFQPADTPIAAPPRNAPPLAAELFETPALHRLFCWILVADLVKARSHTRHSSPICRFKRIDHRTHLGEASIMACRLWPRCTNAAPVTVSAMPKTFML